MSEFLSAEELEITQKEHDAAVWVLDMLESGKIKHDDKTQSGNRFYMPDVARKSNSECGSVCCIAGWMSIHMQGIVPDENGVFTLTEDELRRAVRYFDNKHNEELLNLFIMSDDKPRKKFMAEAKAQHAARALRNYLTTGNAKWSTCFEDDSDGW